MKQGKVQDILVVLGILVVCVGGTFLGIGKLVFVTLAGLLVAHLHLTKERERKEWRYIVIGAVLYLFIRLLYRVSYWEIIDVKQPDMSEILLFILYSGGSYFLYLSLILLISSILSKLWHRAIKAKDRKGKIWPALVVVILTVSAVILYKTRMTQDIKLLSSNDSMRAVRAADGVMTRCMIFKHPPLYPHGICSANLQYFAIFQAEYGDLGHAKLALGDRNGRVYWTKKWSGFTPFVSNIGVVCLIEGDQEGGHRLSFYNKHGKSMGGWPNEKSSIKRLNLTYDVGPGGYQHLSNPISLDGERYYIIGKSEAEDYLLCILSSGDEVWSLKIEKMSLPLTLRISRNGGYVFTDDTGTGSVFTQNFCRVYSIDGEFICKIMVSLGDEISIPDDKNLHISRREERKIDIYELSTRKLIETKGLEEKEEKEEKKDIRTLLKLTSDPDRSTRIEAVRSLGLMGDRRALPRLTWMAKWSRFDLRSAAIGAIGRIRDKDAVPFLIERLEKEENWDVKHGAVWALGHIGDERAVDPLITMLRKGLLVKALSEALVKIGDKRAIGPLKELLWGENSWHREIGIKALVQMGDTSILEDLRDLLDDPDADVRSAAAWGMAKFGVEDGYEVAIECIGISDRAGARWDAIETLALIGNMEAVPYLVKAMQTDGKIAAEALTKMIGEEATPIFVNGLTHERSYVRAASARELGKIGSKREIPYLEKLLDDEFYEVRQAAMKSIEQIGSVGIR